MRNLDLDSAMQCYFLALDHHLPGNFTLVWFQKSIWMWITDYFPNDMDIDGSMRCVVYVHCRGRCILRFCLVRLMVPSDSFLFVFGGYILFYFPSFFCKRLVFFYLSPISGSMVHILFFSVLSLKNIESGHLRLDSITFHSR
jgi:hypothetical protein